MTKAQLKLKIAEAIADLNCGSQIKSLGALKLLETIGDKSVLPSLIEGLKKKDAALTKGILELLSSVQDQDMTECTVDAILHERDSPVRQHLLTTI